MICYFPGKFIDEAFRLFRLIRLKKPLDEPDYQLVTELHDLKWMAVEHFHKELEPSLMKKKESTKRRLLNETYDANSSLGSSAKLGPSRESGSLPRDRVTALEEEVTSLKEENRKLKERLETLEEKVNDLLDHEQPAVAAKKEKKVTEKPVPAKAAKKRPEPEPSADEAPLPPAAVKAAKKTKKVVVERPAPAKEAAKKRPEPEAARKTKMKVPENPAPTEKTSKKRPEPKPDKAESQPTAAMASTKRTRPKTEPGPSGVQAAKGDRIKRNAGNKPSAGMTGTEPQVKRPKRAK